MPYLVIDYTEVNKDSVSNELVSIESIYTADFSTLQTIAIGFFIAAVAIALLMSVWRICIWMCFNPTCRAVSNYSILEMLHVSLFLRHLLHRDPLLSSHSLLDGLFLNHVSLYFCKVTVRCFCVTRCSSCLILLHSVLRKKAPYNRSSSDFSSS